MLQAVGFDHVEHARDSDSHVFVGRRPNLDVRHIK